MSKMSIRLRELEVTFLSLFLLTDGTNARAHVSTNWTNEGGAENDDEPELCPTLDHRDVQGLRIATYDLLILAHDLALKSRVAQDRIDLVGRRCDRVRHSRVGTAGAVRRIVSAGLADY